MKTFAIVANVGFLILMVVMFFTSSTSVSTKDVVIFVCLCAFALLNIAALWGIRGHRGIISLYLERKKLEHEVKIAELRRNVGEKA